MKSLIYGYGITGKSFERYLIKKNIDFDIYDINISDYSSNKDFSKYKKIYCSPGIPREEFKSLKKTNKVLIASGFVNFPGKNKVYHLKELEYIIENSYRINKNEGNENE